MSNKTKHDVMKEAFEMWQKLALTRLGLTVVGIADDKKEALKILLESAFEAGFSIGCHTGMNDVMSDLVEHAKSNGKNGNVIVTDAIPMPGVGHA